jgi:hypothetical protein
MVWDGHGKYLEKETTKPAFEDEVYKSNKQKICGVTILKRVTIQ